MRDPENIRQVLRYRPDYMGFIFHDKSPRYAGNSIEKILDVEFPRYLEKVGVFVNENIKKILEIRKRLQLDMAQLHGNETADLCKSLRAEGLKVVKVFSVGPDFDFQVMEPYVSFADYFLFDTKGTYYGGNARPFDWTLIDNYPFEKPFFLGGGIGTDNIGDIRQIRSACFHAVDINSLVESAPGLKDPEKLEIFRKQFDKIRL